MTMVLRKIRSYVKRDGRMTEAQRTAATTLGSKYILNPMQMIHERFLHSTKLVVEIGFGMGQSLLEMAKLNPEMMFIGIETHNPGVASLMAGCELDGLDNLRIFNHDAVEVLQQCFSPESIDTLQIFFPDPWPKRKHQKRRLIQPKFIELAIHHLKSNGVIHLATDWEDYAHQMMAVLSSFPQLKNTMGENQFSNRSNNRPVITKFERKGQMQGRSIWELQFVKA